MTNRPPAKADPRKWRTTKHGNSPNGTAKTFNPRKVEKDPFDSGTKHCRYCVVYQDHLDLCPWRMAVEDVNIDAEGAKILRALARRSHVVLANNINLGVVVVAKGYRLYSRDQHDLVKRAKAWVKNRRKK